MRIPTIGKQRLTGVSLLDFAAGVLRILISEQIVLDAQKTLKVALIDKA